MVSNPQAVRGRPVPAVRRNQTGRLRPSVFEAGRGGTRKTRGSQPERDNVAVFVTGDLHGGLDIQKLQDWEADEKHVVLYDNIVALGAGSDSW